MNEKKFNHIENTGTERKRRKRKKPRGNSPVMQADPAKKVEQLLSEEMEKERVSEGVSEKPLSEEPQKKPEPKDGMEPQKASEAETDAEPRDIGEGETDQSKTGVDLPEMDDPKRSADLSEEDASEMGGESESEKESERLSNDRPMKEETAVSPKNIKKRRPSEQDAATAHRKKRKPGPRHSHGEATDKRQPMDKRQSAKSKKEGEGRRKTSVSRKKSPSFAPSQNGSARQDPALDESQRRELRHKRRVRNQILAYVSLIVFIALIAGLIIFLGHWLSQTISGGSDSGAETEAVMESGAVGAETSLSETTEAVESYGNEDLLHDMVEAGIAEMSVEDMTAQLFLTTPEALTGTVGVTQAGGATQTALAASAVSGLVYAPGNITSEEQFSGMISDTIGMSKYPLFLILDGTSDTLTQDLSHYGINMKFEERMEADPSSAAFRTTSLGSLSGGSEGEGIVTLQLADGQEDIGQACLDAWQNGADLLYVTSNFQDAYNGLLEKVKEDSSLEDKLKESMERIYGIKYKNQVEQ